MRLISAEQLLTRFPNKYLAVNVASLEARRVIEALHKGDIQLSESPYQYALERTLAGEIHYAKLTDADIEALAREGYEEPVGYIRSAQF